MSLKSRWLGFVASLLAISGLISQANAGNPNDSAQIAKRVDQMILAEIAAAKDKPAAISADEDFLRRVTLDLAGELPSAREVTLFGLDPDPAKRTKLIDRLLESNAHSESWARYWRDVIFLRATNMRARLANDAFLEWMTASLKANKGWDKIATELVTATGEVREVGQTALIFAHEGEPEEIAGEVSRIFLGIQIQCANCHNHPWDRWKREDFHELAAFFPRITVRPASPGDQRSFEVASFEGRGGQRGPAQLLENVDRIFQFADRNRDGRLTKTEVEGTMLERPFDFILQRGDKNKDGALSRAEIKEIPPPPMNMPGRGSSEHMMPDLNNPASPGSKIDPKFFVTGLAADTGLGDTERRTTFAGYLTSSKNEWFAKAFVNRIWAELIGQGFYTPIDDIGPDRKAVHPEVLDLLAAEFTQHDYDVKWLFRTIALTDTYQRKVELRPASEDAPAFASATATRLRGDQLYSSLIRVMGVESQGQMAPRGEGGAAQRFQARSPRDQFATLFGFDPSTPQDDITGNVPQALFMMNSQQIGSQLRADNGTRLAAIVRRFSDDRDALNELYLLVLSREPSDKELKICQDYIKKTGNRNEAYEDLMWSLLNSSEFLSRR